MNLHCLLIKHRRLRQSLGAYQHITCGQFHSAQVCVQGHGHGLVRTKGLCNRRVEERGQKLTAVVHFWTHPFIIGKMYSSFTCDFFLILLYEIIYLSLSSEGNNDKLCSCAKQSKEIHTTLNKQKCIKSLSWNVRKLELCGIAVGDL